MLSTNHKHLPQGIQIRHTSGERLNCSFHATLISLFDYLLVEGRDDTEIEAILNNRPLSFLEAFNQVHHCDLTTREFVDWVRSHQYQGKVDKGFIQMLAPTLREITHQMHQLSSLGRAEVGFCEPCHLGQRSGMQHELTFNYLYLIFGVPITVHRVGFNHICNSQTHQELFYEQPVNQQDDRVAVLHIHQNSSFTHFSSMGYTINDIAPENSLSTGTDYSRYRSPSPLLAFLIRSKNKYIDPVTIALQEDINAFFNDFTKCQIARNLGIEMQQEVDQVTKIVETINRGDFEITTDYLQMFYPNGSQQDLYVLKLWIEANIKTNNDINNLILQLSKPKLRLDRVLYDLLLVLSIIGIANVVRREEHYYISTERNHKSIVRDLAGCLRPTVEAQ